MSVGSGWEAWRVALWASEGQLHFSLGLRNGESGSGTVNQSQEENQCEGFPDDQHFREVLGLCYIQQIKSYLPPNNTEVALRKQVGREVQGTCWHQCEVGYLVTEAVFPGGSTATAHWVGIFLPETAVRYK